VVGPAEHSLPKRVDRWTSLTEISSWMRAAASGDAPFDDDGHAPFPFVASAPDDTTVFCEGAPASDPNRSLKGISLDRTWNHRLLAAYRADGKYVLDLETEEVQHWAPGDDPDHREPERADRADALRWREEIFSTYEARDRETRSRSAGRPALDVSLDARLKSWGYD
jgi:hypothetical protein